jgi:hypothetical protein
MAKLNQIIAIEKDIKSKAVANVDELDKAAQKPDLFNGFTKTYERQDDTTEELPPESKRVQYTTTAALQTIQLQLSALFDVKARLEFTNCAARADVKVGDRVILTGLPVGYLLFLEKQLTDLRTLINRLPVLDNAEVWEYDANAGLHKAQATRTHRTKKMQRPIVLYDATDKHPAQTQLITEDVLAGHWVSIKQSGAMPKPRREKIVDKIATLLHAVKEAREAANAIDEVAHPDVGTAVFNFVLED